MQLLPRAQILITEGHFAPIINICAILFLIFIGISVLGRVFAKLATQRSLNVDDAVIVLAAVSRPDFSYAAGHKRELG